MKKNQKEKIINSLEEVPNSKGKTVIIRAHGVTKEIYCYDSQIAINLGTEVHFIGTNGWLIKKYISNIPNSELCFDDTIKEIKWTFKIQIFLLCILFISLILKEASFFNQQNYKIWTDLISNAIIVGIFGYFLEIIYDLGVALFQIIETNKNN